MSQKKETCEVCNKKADSLKICKSCGRRYCPKCQSPSTDQNFCKNCVSMKGVVSRG